MVVEVEDFEISLGVLRASGHVNGKWSGQLRFWFYREIIVLQVWREKS